MPTKIPKGGWIQSIADEYDVGGSPDLGPMAMAQTEDTDAALGEMAAGLESPPKEAPEIEAPRAAGVPRQAFERLSMLAPTMKAPDATAVDVDATNERDDIERGRDRDAQARLMRSIELGGKQLNAAFGKTPVAELSSPASTSYEKDATARADRGEAKRFSQTQAQLAQAHRQAMLDRQAREDAYRREHDAAEAKRRAEGDDYKQRKDESDAAFAARKLASEEQRSKDRNASVERAAAIAAGKVDYDRAEGIPYGYELLPGAKPSKKQREDAESLTTNSDAMNGNIDELDSLLAKTPKATLLNPTSNESLRMRQIIQAIGANVRVAEGLGVPSGPDTKITADLQGDPANALNIILGRGGSAMQEMRRYSQNKVGAKLKNLGIKKSAPAGPKVWRNAKGEEVEVE